MKNAFPFSAIVGQEALQNALLICAVNPGIGGVLVRGDKGTAKSTAARALADLLPPISKRRGCPFNCPPDLQLPECSVCMNGDDAIEMQPAPFVNLPLGATEDRVIGSLDIERALQNGKRAVQPGLLAAAHRGILYIDEVNLLPDHLVDSLLDAAASGVNRIEREGVAFSHPASFALVGTMNLEEGDLRPQLLDRFALIVDVTAPVEPSVRAEIVRRRMCFEQSSSEFAEQWTEPQCRLRKAVSEARQLYPQVQLRDEQIVFISTMCCRFQVRSLRADIVINKAARAMAALDGRTDVTDEDIKEAAKLALPHRMRTLPGERSSFTDQQLEELMNEFNSSEDDAIDDADGDDEGGSYSDDQLLPSLPKQAVQRISLQDATGQLYSGRRTSVSTTERGAYVRAVKKTSGAEGAIAVDATIRSSICRNEGRLQVEQQDLHVKQRTAKASSTILFIVDASGSMAAMQRMSAVKGAVLGLLEDAYVCRDSVGVIAFREQTAQLVLSPTRSTDVAANKLESLPSGGRTPLPHALQLAYEIAARCQRDGSAPLLVLLTDGKANQALSPSGEPWADVLSQADRIKDAGFAALVVDTESGYVLMGKARNVADALGAEYVKLDDLTSQNLTLEVRSRLKARRS